MPSIILLILQSLTALTNFLMITSSSSMKDDFPFTVGFYYAEDPHTALSFPYPDAELRFHFDSSPDVRIKSPISKKEYKHVKDLVKILPAGVEPGTYDLKWYSGSKVVHKANYTINFVGCNFYKVTPCQEKITDGRKIEPAEGVCVRTSKGKQGAIRKLLSIKDCQQNQALYSDRTNESVCMSDGREVKTDCEAYLTYTMKSRMIFENLDSLKCQPYELLNLSFAWNFYSCDRKMDVLIYHDSFYEARHSGQLKLCIYCGVQWKGYTFHIDMLDKKIKSSEVRCNISTDQYIIVEPKAKKNTILIYGRDSSNVRQLRIRTIYVASERADSTSKDKTPKLSSNPECDRKAGIKTATLKCEWKNTVAGLYQSSRVDVRYMLTNGTVVQNNDELLEIHSAGSYMCQVRVFPAVCPTYDDKERIFHTNATSNVIAVTEDCISSLLKSLPTIPPKTFFFILISLIWLLSCIIINNTFTQLKRITCRKNSLMSSLNFVLVIVFSCIIVLTAITVVVIYVARRNAKKKRKSWLVSTSTDEEGEKRAVAGTSGTKSGWATTTGNTKSADSNKVTGK